MRISWMAVVAGGFLISCGSSGGSGSTGAGGSGGQGGSPGGGATSGSVSGIRVRIANTFLPSGTTGPSLDIYDSGTNGLTSSSKPIIAGLAYGTVSGYVTPHFESPNSTIVDFTALPAGSAPTDTKDAQGIWTTLDDGSHAQVTVLLTVQRLDVTGASPLSGLSFTGFVEKGDDPSDPAGPPAPLPPSGQGEFLASNQPYSASVAGAAPAFYLFVDGSCTPPLNGDPNEPGVPLVFAAASGTPLSSFALFAAAAGSHSVSVVAWTSIDGPTCDQLTAVQGTTTQALTAGQQILTFIYGSSATDVHLLLAPIAP